MSIGDGIGERDEAGREKAVANATRLFSKGAPEVLDTGFCMLGRRVDMPSELTITTVCHTNKDMSVYGPYPTFYQQNESQVGL